LNSLDLNVAYSLCEICHEEADLYPLLSKRYFEKKYSPHWFLCKKCYKEFEKLITYIENAILFLHKDFYFEININEIIKDKNGESKKITPIAKDYFYIKFNPSYIIKNGKHRNGRRKGNNGDLRNDTCAICRTTENLSLHHWFKRAVFGEYNNNSVMTLCLDCHQDVENKIDQMEKQILGQLEEIYYFIQNLLYLKKINFDDDKIFIIHVTRGEDQKYSFILEN